MLFVANVCYIGRILANTYGNRCFEKQQNNCDPVKAFIWQCVSIFCLALGNFLFGEAHWLLAHNYLKVAKNTPRLLNNEIEKPSQYTVSFWVGAICNAVFPLLQLVFWLWLLLAF